MSATATHDSKRGEDMRARLHVLSEVPDEWSAAFLRWQEMNQPLVREVDGEPVPDATKNTCSTKRSSAHGRLAPMSADARDEYADRIVQYMEKALREAKIHTSWMNPSEAYEAAVSRFRSRLARATKARNSEPISARLSARLPTAGSSIRWRKCC